VFSRRIPQDGAASERRKHTVEDDPRLRAHGGAVGATASAGNTRSKTIPGGLTVGMFARTIPHRKPRLVTGCSIRPRPEAPLLRRRIYAHDLLHFLRWWESVHHTADIAENDLTESTLLEYVRFQSSQQPRP
jgi:hypothetical protein